ncbi:lysophospholipid acyltransferase family protein [Pseudopontixanthobacter vadosimaris]|uniref:lysophospholipid acyltransferase family protein n=1 Tax=Pseudopontixanthobacter vadosimaris TaxID=2726450 RepID=UPI001474036A|nr:lysophospholipid acyltransferase family protein [Pseudopontixanthobacter vadosimaris]
MTRRPDGAGSGAGRGNANPLGRLLGWVLAAIRLAAILLLLLICVPLHYLWRALGLGRFWPRLFLGSVGTVLGLRIRIFGQPQRAALLVSNHVTWLDILALARTSGSAFVAHDGLAGFPVLKWLCAMNDTVFIARERPTSVAEQAEDIRRALMEAAPLTIFPEGTTSDGTGLLPFKSALFSACVPLPRANPLQPVLLAYQDVPEVAWIGEEAGADNFRRMLMRLRPVRLDVHFLDPLSGDALADRKAMSKASREALLQAMAATRGPIRR